MTRPTEYERARAQLLFTALGLGAVALATLAALVMLGLGVSGSGTGANVETMPRATTASRDQVQRTADRRAASLSARIPDGQLFARSSFWNKRLPATAPLDASSSGLVQSLVAEVERERAAGIGPWIGTGSGSTRLFRAGAGQPRVRVRLDDPSSAAATALQRAFVSVPIPPYARPATGSDRHMTVWQPSTDRL